jgi:hypothetical protein
VKWIQTQNWTPHIKAFLPGSLDMHQSGKHAGMSSENLVFENVIYIANKPKSFGQAIRSTDTLKNVRKCSQLTTDCNYCLWYFQCWSFAEMIDQWWSLTHKGCWLQMQMKFYNNESMKDLTRPVKWKMWASYIIKHNINVLVESVILLSGNLNFFCSPNAFKLMLLVMCMLNVKQI